MGIIEWKGGEWERKIDEFIFCFGYHSSFEPNFEQFVDLAEWMLVDSEGNFETIAEWVDYYC